MKGLGGQSPMASEISLHSKSDHRLPLLNLKFCLPVTDGIMFKFRLMILSALPGLDVTCLSSTLP